MEVHQLINPPIERMFKGAHQQTWQWVADSDGSEACATPSLVSEG